MLIAIELLVLAFCAALWAPDTLIGNTMRAMLIDAPAKAYRRATLLQMIVGLIVLFSLAAFLIVAPEWITLFGFGDLASYLDVGLILLLTSAAERLKSPCVRMVRFARDITARVVARWGRARGRNRLSRPRRPKALPTSDDDGGAEWDWAFV
ncbi:MAG: hypothetical protein P4L57_15515 [Rhizomicrobium sp.]|nr:hypothetical protein [Rhizomicrobium sp.]